MWTKLDFVLIDVSSNPVEGLLWYIFTEQIDTTLEKEMYEQANQQVTDDTSKGLNRAWNELQYRVNCCDHEIFLHKIFL